MEGACSSDATIDRFAGEWNFTNLRKDLVKDVYYDRLREAVATQLRQKATITVNQQAKPVINFPLLQDEMSAFHNMFNERDTIDERAVAIVGAAFLDRSLLGDVLLCDAATAEAGVRCGTSVARADPVCAVDAAPAGAMRRVLSTCSMTAGSVP